MNRTSMISNLIKARVGDGRLSNTEISLTRFAHDLGVSRVTATDWRAGRVPPTLENYLKILEYFDITEKDLQNFK